MKTETESKPSPQPISYVLVGYDLFPYFLAHPVYRWSDKGEPICTPEGRGLSFYREAILTVIDVERGIKAEKAIYDARAKLDKIQQEAIERVGNNLIETFYELKGKVCYESGKATHPK